MLELMLLKLLMILIGETKHYQLGSIVMIQNLLMMILKKYLKNTSSRLDLLMFPKVNSEKEVLKFDELVTAYENKFKRKK